MKTLSLTLSLSLTPTLSNCMIDGESKLLQCDLICSDNDDDGDGGKNGDDDDEGDL